MPSFKEVNDWITGVRDQLFPGGAPEWVSTVIAWTLFITLLLLGLWGALSLLAKIKEVWTKSFQPMLYDAKARRRAEQRRRFANHIEGELRRLNNLEEWRDYRFTELEAHVEAEGRRQSRSFFSFGLASGGLRHERSLSAALRYSAERLILLEGEPGSGKSIALRHVCESLAHRAMRSKNVKSLVPIYVNLKELTREVID
jgi:hypothetical protein